MTKVKLLRGKSTSVAKAFLKQFPHELPVWEGIEFTFDPDDEHYDWLVVIDKTPAEFPCQQNRIACPSDQTIFVATEPSTITYYGEKFVSQFNYLITNQEESRLPHRNAWRVQPGSRWYYGKSYSKISSEGPPKKTGLLSAIATDKQQKHTMHHVRFQFLKLVAKEIPETDLLFSRPHMADVFHELFGDRAKLVTEKFDMIDSYKYHLAIGNQVGDHILTERVLDSLLGYAVPISFGCTNLGDYFPVDSFVDIDITKPDDAIKVIKDIISQPGDYERRLPAIIEARDRVLNKYNLIAMIAGIVKSHRTEETGVKTGKYLFGRRLARLFSAKDFLGFLAFKLKNATATGTR